MNVDEKIKTRMDKLQKCMEENVHLYEKLYVMDLYYSAKKYWSRLSEEDKDYLHAVEYALENNSKWVLD